MTVTYKLSVLEEVADRIKISEIREYALFINLQEREESLGRSVVNSKTRRLRLDAWPNQKR
jgi:hypothetical protein